MNSKKIALQNRETDSNEADTVQKRKPSASQKILAWTPKVLAERTGVSVPTLHFYEDKGLIFSTRTQGNQRRYNRSMVRRIAFIQAGKNAGITLTEIKQVLDKLPKNRTPTRKDWELISSEWREALNARIVHLENMRDKFSQCIRCGCLSFESCAIYNPEDIHAVNNNDFVK